jgi:hypothetical protein
MNGCATRLKPMINRLQFIGLMPLFFGALILLTSSPTTVFGRSQGDETHTFWMSVQFFVQCETDIATRTDRGCVQRTSRSHFASQGALDKLDTTGHSNPLRLVFDTAALRRRSPTPSAWWTAITKTPARPAIYPGHTRGILLDQNRLVALRHFGNATHRCAAIRFFFYRTAQTSTTMSNPKM